MYSTPASSGTMLPSTSNVNPNFASTFAHTAPPPQIVSRPVSTHANSHDLRPYTQAHLIIDEMTVWTAAKWGQAQAQAQASSSLPVQSCVEMTMPKTTADPTVQKIIDTFKITGLLTLEEFTIASTKLTDYTAQIVKLLKLLELTDVFFYEYETGRLTSTITNLNNLAVLVFTSFAPLARKDRSPKEMETSRKAALIRFIHLLHHHPILLLAFEAHCKYMDAKLALRCGMNTPIKFLRYLYDSHIRLNVNEMNYLISTCTKTELIHTSVTKILDFRGNVEQRFQMTPIHPEQLFGKNSATKASAALNATPGNPDGDSSSEVPLNSSIQMSFARNFPSTDQVPKIYLRATSGLSPAQQNPGTPASDTVLSHSAQHANLTSPAGIPTSLLTSRFSSLQESDLPSVEIDPTEIPPHYFPVHSDTVDTSRTASHDTLDPETPAYSLPESDPMTLWSFAENQPDWPFQDPNSEPAGTGTAFANFETAIIQADKEPPKKQDEIPPSDMPWSSDSYFWNDEAFL